MARLLSDQRETEAGALVLVAEAHERLEDASAVGAGDAGAVVLDEELGHVTAPQRHAHGSPRTAVAGGVLAQVVWRRPQAGLPRVDRDGAVRDLGAPVHAGVALTRGRERGVHGVGQVERLE